MKKSTLARRKAQTTRTKLTKARVSAATPAHAEKPAPRAAEAAKPGSALPRASASFPIVGIGASAGGLEALELFLKEVPPDSGMGFVVVQHLDPTHKGILVELLQRATTIPVVQIEDRMRVEPNRVHVIPPNRDLSILNRVLHLLEPAAPRGLRLPIDFFFRSLAADQQERTVGVILSGMGSDGTLGIRAIKEKAGAVFVQTPESAKFDGMPRSAIESGLADVVAPVGELAGKIIAYRSNVPLLGRTPGDLAAEEQGGTLEKIVILLRAQTGHDFSHYKKATICRRIERRMGLHQLGRITDYVRYLRENPQEADLLFKELLIGVTSFFRDPAAWDQLRDDVLPALIEARSKEHVLRAWTAGCSTGEEAYSLAIVFKEALERLHPGRQLSLQVFATDLDKDAIDRARQAIYPANIAADVSEARLARFFVPDERGGYRVGKEIREMVIFATQNLVMDPPFTKLDLLTCRNLLIYMDAPLQAKLVPLFHYSLNTGGILMLGSSETVGTASDLFAPLPGKTRLYRRLEDGRPRPEERERPGARGLPASTSALDLPPKPAAAPNLQALADRLILQRYAPSAVLAGSKGDILYVSGRTGKYLEPAAGKANWNVFAMARPGLSLPLNEAFNKALRLGTSVTVHGLRVGTNGGTQVVDITAEPVDEPEALRGTVLVLFTEVPTPPAAKERGTPVQGVRVKALTQEVRLAREELQSTREEMQTSQEELKSTNEELQSTNEELQSTNEELTTSKEEMQSMNEELQTVNHELQAKVDELSRANNDMKNLLNSTDIATLFLDDALKVRRFTSSTTSIIKLIPGDAGRPITDLVTELNYPGLVTDVQEVLRTLVPREQAVSTRDDRWFTVRIMPYRTLDNRIDGVVITFVDITQAKRLEASLRATEARLRESIKGS